MTQSAVALSPDEEPEIVSYGLMTRIFVAFAVLALLSVALSFAGRWFGSTISLAGYTDDATPKEIVIGNNVIVAPANTIRFERARSDGVASRLDLYMRWPLLDGYSREARDDFNNVGNRRRIVFLTFEQRMMSRDMSGRFAPIYRSLIVEKGSEGPAGISLHAFTAASGYLNEELAIAGDRDREPFVARCLTGPSAEESLAPCERDLHIGDNLSLTYRFSRDLLAEWRVLDHAVRVRASQMLKTGR